ncbi:MAG: NAD(P)/FAD-dependent oxidoreductase, partial [Candidatus Zixiibacteriota bacterium]
MTKQADVVIIGGGIIGTAVAFYLSQTDIGRIVLLEREPFLGAGATSKAAGGIRAQFANRVNIEMSMLSEKLFCQFEEDTGSPALFDRVGYVFVLKDETDVANFKQSYKLQRSLGLNVQWLERDEIAQHVPEVDLSDVLAATYCGDDGLGDPHEFLSGYDKAIRGTGVE